MRVRTLSSVLCGAAAFAALGLAPPEAGAQETTEPGNLALSRLLPAPAGDRMFGVQSPYVAGSFAVHGMLLVDYAHNPLVVFSTAKNDTVGSIVGDQLYLHAGVSLALFNRMQLSVDMPFALFQSGDDPSELGGSFPEPGTAVGDLAVGVRVALLGQSGSPLQIGVGGYIWVPTGSAGEYVSDRKVRGLPQAIVGGRTSRIVWSVAAGPEIRPSQRVVGVEQGPMMNIGAGLGFLVGEDRDLQIGPEATASFVFSDINKRTTNAEVMLDARYRFLSFMEAGIGVGPGLSSGVGTPTVRAVAMLAYTPEEKQAPPPSDRDGDGFIDAVDACPDVKGEASEDPAQRGCPPLPPPDKDGDGIIDVKDACPDIKGVASEDPRLNGCPPDRDQDGVPDGEDACPDVAGVRDADPKKNGCPPDKDGDGVYDKDDACVDVPGIKTADPATNGCPGDTDGDTIRDDKDACPLEKGKPNKDPTKNGCPTAVRVTETEVIILQQVQFDTAKATIKKVSDPLLDEVAGVLKEHPEIMKIEVQGHTDNKGTPTSNDKLSQDRADSVMKALIKRNVDKGRLVAKGYGQSVPIADNATEAGRQQNRRVQFKILEKVPRSSLGPARRTGG